jgi:hypothetical protein
LVFIDIDAIHLKKVNSKVNRKPSKNLVIPLNKKEKSKSIQVKKVKTDKAKLSIENRINKEESIRTPDVRGDLVFSPANSIDTEKSPIRQKYSKNKNSGSSRDGKDSPKSSQFKVNFTKLIFRK